MLIIIESPGKKSSIEKYTGAKVMATFGHFKDLPVKQLGVDLTTFDPTFKAESERQLKVLKDLKFNARGEDVIIATDKDREGDAIGVMVYQEIKGIAKSIKRAYFGEITKEAVKKGIDNAIPFEKFNMNVYGAFLGRRVADRLVGYLLSSIANAKAGWVPEEDDTTSLTVGRVQTIGVKMIVDREREIKNFVPVPYYVLKAELNAAAPFMATHKSENFSSKNDADDVYSKISHCTTGVVKDIEKKEGFSSPKAPFITSTLQSEAFKRLGLSAQQTMTLAQRLYEGFGDGGYITYMRTDSAMLSDDFLKSCGEFLKKTMPEHYSEPRQYKTKTSQAEAHEGIRPTKTLHTLKQDVKDIENGMLRIKARPQEAELAGKLYEMIVLRAIASQMKPAKFDRTIYKIEIGGEMFLAKGSVLVEPGYKALFDDVEKESEDKMPIYKVGDNVDVSKIFVDSKATTPPSRFNEPSLIAKLEKDGIGRPSTYASIINVLTNRNYATIEKKNFVPTAKAECLIDFLEREYKFVVNQDFTAEMEAFLDEVEEKGKDWKNLQRDLYEKMGRPVLGDKNFISAKQLQYAESLSKASGIELTEEIRNNRELLSKFIDEARKTATVTLSDKQLAVVEKNAPDDIKALVNVDNKKVAEWIKSYFDEIYGRGNSTKKAPSKTTTSKRKKAS